MKKWLLLWVFSMCMLPVAAQQTQEDPQRDTILLEVYDSSTQQTALLPLDETLTETPAVTISEGPVEEESLSITPSKKSIKQINDNRVVLLYAGHQQCSGAMVGPYTVLTAGHCISDNKGNIIKASSIKVYAGGTSGNIVATGDTIFYSRLAKIPGGHNYSNIILRNADVAIIVVDKPIGRKTGYFGTWNPVLTVGLPIEIRGFPGSKAKDKPWLSKGFIVGEDISVGGPVFGPLTHGPLVYGPSFAHLAFVEPGSSGSPNFLPNKPNHIFAVAASGGLAWNLSSRGLLNTLVGKYRHAQPKHPHKPLTAQMANQLRKKSLR